MTRHILLLIAALLVLPSCTSKIIRVGPNYQAEVEADADFAAAVVPLLEEKVDGLRAAEQSDACEEIASLLVYARWWAPHLAKLRLAAAGLGDAPENDPSDVPSPAALCGQED